MAKAKTPPRSTLAARPPPPQGIAPLPESPTMDDSLSAAVAAAKKKKKKGKGKKADDELANGNLLPQSIPNTPFSATAQAQADLLATASDLYRRIEADPQGIPDDDAYWTSLPSHLRTFIRNALPIGQLPPSARNESDDPNGRHASTQAMIAVAQQLAQAAHASQRHLQQHPPSGNANFQNTNNVAYPPFPFDPSVFADIALQTEQILPLHSHPNGADYRYSQTNPPPTQPPGEPLPPPVMLVNEFDDEQGEFDDDYYSDDDMDPQEAATLDSRDGTWSNEMNGTHQNGIVAKTPSAAAKKKNKKKKKKGGTEAINTAAPPMTAPLAPPSNPPRTNAVPPTPAPLSNTANANTNAARLAAQALPPSSRAAGKQPMTFNAAGGKAPVNNRPTNGHTHSHGPVSNAIGKRPASAAASSHEHGSVNGAGAQSTTRAWSSSSAEERERIKEFWLGLNERERKNLIKIEKDGVLRKMKEQQKHGCSCAVCGRKRSSIEDELEVLYDAYYDELEQYASDQQKYVESGGQVPPPPGPGPFPGSVALDSQGAVIGGNALTKPPSKRQHQHTHPPPISRTKAALPPEDDDAYDEDLEDDDYEDEYEYEDEEDEEDELDEPDVKPSQRRRPETGPARTNANTKASNDLFNFGSSLTVKGGILTVADDLLKNDGQKFLEMMEQLAERRALREEEVQAELDNASEEEELDEEDEEEEGEEVEEDALTDEQRMEEGRRMFQIFAARMFEQRVLQAYRERVAQERQLQLLRELEEEDNAEKEREAKKAKENQKKKDKKKQAKQQKEEERIKKEEEKAAEEAAARAKIEKQREAELKKQDEIRLKREAEKRQKDEEKARKEEERRKRQEEERNRELEKERKKREKEEKIRMEKEAKEAKEREAKAAKEEEERRAKEQAIERQQAQEKLAREEQAKIEADRLQKEQQAKEAAARQASPDLPQAKAQAAPLSSGLPKSPSSTVQGGASSPVARKVSANLPPSSPAQHRSAAPLPSSAAAIGSSQRGAGVARPLMPNQSVASPSTLPAPPQGLPARPSTVSHAPSAAASILAGGSSLPRPPIQASSVIPASIGSPVRQGTPTNSTASSTGLNKLISPSLATGPPLSASGGSSFAKTNVGSVAPLTSQPQSRYPVMGFGNTGGASTPTRSPPAALASNGFMSGTNGKSAFDSVLGSPSSVNATAAGLASLSMGSTNTSQMPIGPIGGGLPSTSNASSLGPLHSRNASMGAGNALDEYGRQGPGSSSGSSRLISRPAPGPIGPIGQQRRDLNLDEMAPGGVTSSIFGSNPMPERILGSSALGGDDELVEPQPRRTSHHTAPMSNSLFGTGAFGVTSPWASTFASSGASNGGGGSGTVPRTPSTPGSSMLHGALGTGLTSPTSVTGSAALGNLHQTGPSLNSGVDPWARASTGWDRARFAFEQPSGGQQQSSVPSSFQQQQQQQQQQSQQAVGPSPLSPFGTQPQHPLRGMFGVPGQAHPMSPNRHTTDRSGL